MNRIKGSIALKIFVQIGLFLSGLILLIATYHVFTYLDSYTTSTNNFTETSEFQSKYLKYVERVAVYIDYREKGYTSSVGYDSNSIDLSALFEKDKKRDNKNNSETGQKDFDYYNAILNETNTNFLYYVKNLNTGAIYYSPNLEDTVKKQLASGNPEEAMDQYLKRAQSNPAYLIINTSTQKFITNVNRTYQYLNDENLRWVIDYISGNVNGDFNITKEDVARDEYIICTTIAKGFPNRNDEFGIMYDNFIELHDNYKMSLYPVPISFVLLLFFFGLAIAFAGHKKGVEGISINSFDRLYTEIGFLVIVICIGILYLLGARAGSILFYDFHLKYYYVLMFGYAIMYPICMVGLLSVIRRFKANVLYQNSLLFKGISKFTTFIKNFFAQRNLTYQVIFWIILFAFMQAIAFYVYNKPILFGRKFEFIVVSAISYYILAYVFLKAAIDFNILKIETKKITEGNLTHKIPIEKMSAPAKALGEYINNIGDGLSGAVDEKLKSERLKTELIANVSHDIKTPLTSIINYVDLLKKENLGNEVAVGYLEILSTKSWRLKTLIEDLVEASKASSGTITLNLECLNLVELVRQSIGEFEDKLLSHNLEPVLSISEEPVYILADGRSTYRIIENIFSNVFKYALSGTRVYVDITADEKSATVSVKNISANKLNINADELMERFVRGDLARNTEGSGLGLSISKSLAALQDATFDIILDGDLFKAMVKFHRIEQPPKISYPVIDDKISDETETENFHS
jgi:signal transduction histidine kinase